MSEKTFILGERRKVTLSLALGEEVPLIPESPVWELVSIDTGQTENTGECEIVEDEGGIFHLSALVEPKVRGLYRLYFQFTLDTEIRKPYMVIKVI